MTKTPRVNVEVSQAAHLRLMAEVYRRQLKEGRGKTYPVWRVIDDLLMSLPEPDEEPNPAYFEDASWR